MAPASSERRSNGTTAQSRDSARAPGQGSARFADRVRTVVSHELNARKDRVSDGLDGVAEMIRRVAEPLRDDPYVPLAGYTELAARRLEGIANDLRDRDVGDLARDLGDLARSRPAVFVGAGLAAGLLAARFLKSSAEASDEGRRPTRKTGRQPEQD